MGANVEFNIFLKKEDFSFGWVIALVRKMAFDIDVEMMKVFDGWTYENEVKIDPCSLDLKTSSIFLERFTLTRFVVNNYWHGGLITSFADTYVELGFWLSLEDVMRMGKDSNDDPIGQFYDQLVLYINRWSRVDPWKTSFLAASIGIEYGAEFKADVREMLQDDNGVERWILAKRIVKDLEVEKLKREEKENVVLFCHGASYHEDWL
jgi:hypothetical protein